MYALIQKSDNQILRVSSEGATLSSEKPFQWVQCPEGVTTAWTYNGETFQEPVIVQPVPTQFELFEAVRAALQLAIDNKARTFNFSNGNSLMLYAGFVNPFQTLAQVFATWEASVWFEAETYRQEVLAGTKPILSPEQAVALMPEYPV